MPTTKELPTTSIVPPVDWSNIRLVYKKLQDDFYRITEPFGISVSEETSLDEVSRRMSILRTIIKKRGIQTEFCKTVESTLTRTEAKRAAKSERLMIDEMREEWRLTGHLTVLILRPESNAAFEKFFYLCCEMMTAVDMIQDAVSDYRQGQISVFPWPTLYLRLLAEFVLPMPKLIWRFPKPTGLIKYAASFLYEVYWPFKLGTNIRQPTDKQ